MERLEGGDPREGAVEVPLTALQRDHDREQEQRALRVALQRGVQRGHLVIVPCGFRQHAAAHQLGAPESRALGKVPRGFELGDGARFVTVEAEERFLELYGEGCARPSEA